MAVAAIDVTGIGKSYQWRRRPEDWVLRDISLRVTEGTVLGLLGPNGAGKTTLIKILAGLLRPDAGAGAVLGYDLLRQPSEIRARVNLVAPTVDVGIDNNLTVWQNLAFWAPIFGLRGAAARARIDELLAQLDLGDKADAWPMYISAGQRQRLALARSLLARNRLVFLDEPTNKLDLEGVRSVRKMISELNTSYGVTMVLTTHVMEEAEELCGEIALLRQGELVAHRPTTELIQTLNLARTIKVTLRRGGAKEMAPEANWRDALAALPGVISVAAVPSTATRVGPAAAGAVTFTAQSTDLRATTPALVSWVRHAGLVLTNMEADPVTLSDVFRTLTREPEASLSPNGRQV